MCPIILQQTEQKKRSNITSIFSLHDKISQSPWLPTLTANSFVVVAILVWGPPVSASGASISTAAGITPSAANGPGTPYDYRPSRAPARRSLLLLIMTPSPGDDPGTPHDHPSCPVSTSSGLVHGTATTGPHALLSARTSSFQRMRYVPSYSFSRMWYSPFQSLISFSDIPFFVLYCCTSKLPREDSRSYCLTSPEIFKFLCTWRSISSRSCIYLTNSGALSGIPR